MGTRENEQGVSFTDVARHMRDITSRRGGYVCYSISADKDREGRLRLSVMLEHREHIVLNKCNRHAKRVWAYWPSGEFRTFSGLLLNLCFQLDERLDQDEQLAQAQMPF